MSERAQLARSTDAVLKGGTAAIRACVVNFRTGDDDVEAVATASAEIGRRLPLVLIGLMPIGEALEWSAWW